MDQWRVGRREFVLGGAAAASAALCVGPLRAFGRLMPAADASLLACPESGAWADLSMGGVVRELQNARVFGAGGSGGDTGGAAIVGAARMTLVGGMIDERRAGASGRVRIEFPKGRVVEALGLRAGEGTASVAMNVPVGDGAVYARLALVDADGKETEQRVRIPAKRGTYAIVVDPGASRGVRWADGRVESDAACCVVLSLDSCAATTGKDK